MLWGVNNSIFAKSSLEEEEFDMTVDWHPELTSKLVDVTLTTALNTSRGLVLSTPDSQARGDRLMTRMFWGAAQFLLMRRILWHNAIP